MKRLLHLFSALALAVSANAQNSAWGTISAENTILTSYSQELPVSLTFSPAAGDTFYVLGTHWGPNNYRMAGKCWKDGKNTRMKLLGKDAQQTKIFVSGILEPDKNNTLKLKKGEIATIEQGKRPEKKALTANFAIDKQTAAKPATEKQTAANFSFAPLKLNTTNANMRLASVDMDSFNSEKNETWAMLTLGGTTLVSDTKGLEMEMTFFPQPDGNCAVKATRLGSNPYEMEGNCWKYGNSVVITLSNTDQTLGKTVIYGTLKKDYGWRTVKLSKATITTSGKGFEPVQKKIAATFNAKGEKMLAVAVQKEMEAARDYERAREYNQELAKRNTAASNYTRVGPSIDEVRAIVATKGAIKGNSGMRSTHNCNNSNCPVKSR